MDDHAPTRLKLDIAAFRAIAAAVTEAEIAGDVESVTISALQPELQLIGDAVALELSVAGGPGGAARPQTWIVAGDGRVLARVEEGASQEAAEDEDDDDD
jgi:hypothetical protein